MERSVAIEDYVRAIYQLQQQEKPVATTALARPMYVAPAAGGRPPPARGRPPPGPPRPPPRGCSSACMACGW